MQKDLKKNAKKHTIKTQFCAPIPYIERLKTTNGLEKHQKGLNNTPKTKSSEPKIMGFFRVIRNAPIVSVFIVLMLIFCAWFFLYDDSSPKAVRNYVKGKFPISDYLYKKADKKKIQPQNNVVK
ncbi:hypothetical protein HpCOL14_05920 [Helicobacter pylori]